MTHKTQIFTCLFPNHIQIRKLISLFKRIGWSPDGSAFIVPNGQFLEGQSLISCSFIFESENPTLPILALPHRENSSVVQFCPLFLSKRENESSIWKSDYNFLYCIAAQSELYLYESTSTAPLYVLSEMHYASITDICWFDQGKYIAISSRDGYITFIQVDSQDLKGSIKNES